MHAWLCAINVCRRKCVFNEPQECDAESAVPQRARHTRQIKLKNVFAWKIWPHHTQLLWYSQHSCAVFSGSHNTYAAHSALMHCILGCSIFCCFVSFYFVIIIFLFFYMFWYHRFHTQHIFDWPHEAGMQSENSSVTSFKPHKYHVLCVRLLFARIPFGKIWKFDWNASKINREEWAGAVYAYLHMWNVIIFGG